MLPPLLPRLKQHGAVLLHAYNETRVQALLSEHRSNLHVDVHLEYLGQDLGLVHGALFQARRLSLVQIRCQLRAEDGVRHLMDDV